MFLFWSNLNAAYKWQLCCTLPLLRRKWTHVQTDVVPGTSTHYSKHIIISTDGEDDTGESHVPLIVHRTYGPWWVRAVLSPNHGFPRAGGRGGGGESLCGFRAGRSAKIWGRCDSDKTPPASTREAEVLGRKHGTSVSSHYDTLTRGRVRPPWRVLPLRAASGQYLSLVTYSTAARSMCKHCASQPSPFTQ